MTNFRTAKYDSSPQQLAIDDPNKTADVNSAQATIIAEAANAFVRSYPAVFQSMRGATGVTVLPLPIRAAVYQSTGTVRYVRFGAGGTNSGTLANPYTNSAGIAAGLTAMVAGDALLFAAGAPTATITASLAAVTGTSVAPIIFGVYDPATGRRVTGRVGAASITCAGAAINGVALASKNWTCVDGLAITGNSGATDLVSITGTSGNCQIVNCRLTASTRYGVFLNASGGSNLVEGNLITGGTNGIWHQMPGADTTTVITYNTIRSVLERGILVYDGFSGIAASVTIACNSVEDGAVSDFQLGGIEFTCGGGASRIFRNSVKRFGRGIRIVSSLSGSSVAANFGGTIVQNNETRNNEFGILLSGAFGNWTIELNRVYDSGSRTGAAPVSLDQWGRGIELFGAVAGMAVSDGTVRFNFVTGSYNWPGVPVQGTEGIGIGLDDNTRNVFAYGNYCVANEGSAFNINGGGGGAGANNNVFGNICADNCKLRPGRVLVLNHPSLSSEIHMSVCPDTSVFNNTLVCVSALYGYADYSSFTSDRAQIRNNLIVDARVAAMRIDTAAGKTTERNNVAASCAAIAVNLAGAAVAPGTSTIAVNKNVLDIVPDLYQPRAGSVCDGTGFEVPAWALAFDGSLLNSPVPIGALPAVV